MPVVTAHQQTTVVIPLQEDSAAAICDSILEVVQFDAHVDECVHVEHIHVAEWVVVIHAERDEHVVAGWTCDVAAAAFNVIFFWVDV